MRLRLTPAVAFAARPKPPAARIGPPDELSGERGAPTEFGGRAELLLDPQQLVVLGDAIRARRGAGLDLTAAGGDGEVGDRHVLGLARSVADDHRVRGFARHRDRRERLGEGADLVYLHED